MRALVEDLHSGRLLVCEVPRPELQPGGILVRTHFSAISSGTECAKIEMGEKSLLEKAIARPDLVRQAVNYARTHGVKAAYEKVRARLDALSAMGYSCAGTVLAVSEGITDFRPGDRVACGGGGYATHSEINFVPRNLAVPVPDSVPLDVAAFATIGAIAIQGFRQSGAVLGETVAVIGAGLIGVLAVQMARAAGCRVIAIDRDAGRADRAVQMGAGLGLTADDPNLITTVKEFSRYGVDAALVTAAGHSPEPLELASRLLRDRGRIVIVGDVPVEISRQSLYMKEGFVLLSRSYGPGRYDSNYEEGGMDYPIGYVRWTERRNMEAFLDLLEHHAVNLAPLLEHQYPIGSGAQAYEEIRRNGAYTAILIYEPVPAKVAAVPPQPSASRLKPGGALRVSFIGAGGFARSVLLPVLRSRADVELESVATASGVGAESARRVFSFRQTRTAGDVLKEENTDLLFVVSRHDTHARYVMEAITHRKPVFVEKPLAATRPQLQELRACHQTALADGYRPFAMVGFNRRFAPATQRIRQFFATRREPMMILIRVNAGYLEPNHWVHRDGGRIVGEMCHFVDWARAVVGAPIVRVQALALPDGARYTQDNVTALLLFADGSRASVNYLANGTPRMPKEHFEVFCQGGIAQIEDFRRLILARDRQRKTVHCHRDKGHRQELEETLRALRENGVSPIPFEELVEVTEATFAILDSIASGEAVKVSEV